jgi:RNA exonuclease 4
VGLGDLEQPVGGVGAAVEDDVFRALAQIGLCDADGTPVLNVYVKPDVPVVSYLGPITGLSAALIEEKGVPLADALARLRAALPPTAFLCGQSIAKDIEWLGLKEGTDFACAIDLAALFRVWTAESRYAYFRQDHTASVWLRGTPYERAHGAATLRADSPALVSRARSAPAARSARTTSTWPFSLAM